MHLDTQDACVGSLINYSQIVQEQVFTDRKKLPLRYMYYSPYAMLAYYEGTQAVSGRESVTVSYSLDSYSSEFALSGMLISLAR